MKNVLMVKKTMFLIALMVFSGMTMTAQMTVDAELKGANEFRFNGYQLDDNLSLARLQTKLGEADEEVEQAGTERLYKYNDLGVTVMTADGEVKGFAMNYNWDGDDKVPETTLNGTLTILGEDVSADWTQKEFSDLKGLKVDCPMPMMCVVGEREDKLMKMISFNEEGKVTQVIVALTK